MRSMAHRGSRRRVPGLALVLAAGAWMVSGPSAMGQDGIDQTRQALDCQKPCPVHDKPEDGAPSAGMPGCGKPGLSPGFQGFGLGYHLGYGYGGDAQGVGATGGYPFYGGPGYCHPWPRLRRLGSITPFPYYGGPGYPTPEHPEYYGAVGPLMNPPLVITIGSDGNDPSYTSGYGAFTGVLPYPEAYFARSTAEAASGAASTIRSRAGDSSAPGTGVDGRSGTSPGASAPAAEMPTQPSQPPRE
jgi:hypothetical protein